MKIAVIGSGISGLTSAWLLSRKHRVYLFEKRGRLGGHTHTIVHQAECRELSLARCGRGGEQRRGGR